MSAAAGTRRLRVAVVGATGAVGQDLRRLLEVRDFPCDEVVFAASARSAGKVLPFRGQQVVVRDLDEADVFDGVDLALFSAGGGASREHAPRAVAAGAVVVDNSSAWRMDPEVPLVVTEVNADALELLRTAGKGIVANPNCTTMVAMLPLKALHDAFGLVGFTATSFQAAGGAGQKGIDELEAQVGPMFARRELLRSDGKAAMNLVDPPKVHADVLAFNVVPVLGTLDDHGYTDEEYKLQNESRKILSLPDLAVAPTCVRVPVMVGHALQVRAVCTDPMRSLADVIASLDHFPGLVVEQAPTPLEWAGRDGVAVGRLRLDLTDPHALNLWVTGDNLLKGAALNTVQIAEELARRELV
ncbi:MAG: aspartate-semialdehyde dehydrogenase [Euzebyales bacterium]|nr:aspartate-semialdehyde dehydrogenase [Euzebyales bacterium]